VLWYVCQRARVRDARLGDHLAGRDAILASSAPGSCKHQFSASFGPSAVRVNTETVYSGRREADLVMTSTRQMV